MHEMLKKEKQKLITVGIIVAVDQLIKQLLLKFGYNIVLNKKGFLGLFDSNKIAIIVFVFLLIFLYFFIIAKKKEPSLGFLMVMGGGISNGFDFILHKGIIDYIKLSFLPLIGNYLPIFNLADLAISTGVIIIVINMIITEEEQD